LKREQLRYELGRLLGTIATQSNGKIEARDALARFKGTYDPKSNETRDSLGRLVGKGNLLAALITAD